MKRNVRQMQNHEQNWNLASELGLSSDDLDWELNMPPNAGEAETRYSAPRQLPSARLFSSTVEWVGSDLVWDSDIKELLDLSK